MGYQKMTIIGNLGKDPELRYTGSGKAVCGFSVAVSEKRPDGEGKPWKEVTTWFKVTVWGNQAEACDKYLAKGRPVYIEGSFRLEEWTDRDGNKRTTPEINASVVQFLGGSGEGGGSGSSERTPGPREQARQARQQAAPATAPASGGDVLDISNVPDDQIPF